MADGFFGRWSRRKLDAGQAKPLEPQPALVVPVQVAIQQQPGSGAVDPGLRRDDKPGRDGQPAGDGQPGRDGQPARVGSRGDDSPRDDSPGLDGSPGRDGSPPPLTLEDAQALTSESDFRPFAARGVAPEVKNAAMKKLFSNPHFNLMDRMDVYIDDYSQPDPLPPALLRKLASAKFLGLFDEEEKHEAEQAAREPGEVPNNLTDETVAQFAATPAALPNTPHADPDLRLQPDHASAGKDPGSSAA